MSPTSRMPGFGGDDAATVARGHYVSYVASASVSAMTVTPQSAPTSAPTPCYDDCVCIVPGCGCCGYLPPEFVSRKVRS